MSEVAAPLRRSVPAPGRLSGARRLTPIAPWPEAGTLDEHVRAEQVRAVFKQAPAAQVLGIVAGGVVAWVLRDVGDRPVVLTWLAVVTLVTLGRIGIALAFQRAAPAPRAMARWETIFLASLAVITLTWGVGGWLIMPHEAPLHEAIVYFFLMGVAGGAAASYAAHPTAAAIAIPAIMLPASLTLLMRDSSEMRALAVGGALYIAVAIRGTRNYGFFLRRTYELSWELHRAYALAQQQARTDELTGLANRRAFVEHGAGAVEQARRYKRPLALVMFDIDHFKKINDGHGHAAGDAVLRDVAALTMLAVRASDTAGRLGGEEFAVLLPETGGPAAAAFAERLRDAVTELRVSAGDAEIRLTCSFGVAELDEKAATLDALLRVADEALYRAKEGGRNRVAA